MADDNNRYDSIAGAAQMTSLFNDRRMLRTCSYKDNLFKVGITSFYVLCKFDHMCTMGDIPLAPGLLRYDAAYYGEIDATFRAAPRGTASDVNDAQ